MASETPGILLLVAWVEDGVDNPIRARITSTSTVRNAAYEVDSAAGVEEICQAVRNWLLKL